ncbi:response regulator [Agaribacter flavus]|uniref:Response regulator n=1 Tax=Agaribacter flavus TaxID=1902781 RepID=A0ABV7FNL6_9ALTE
MEKLDYSDKRCLLVEDRRPFLLLLKGLLSNLGAKRVTTELTAEGGLKACKNTRYDIIICDLHLGNNRKNGFELLEEIRKRRLVKPSTVFIMISGDSAKSMVLGSIEKQPDDYLIKPFSQAQLNARITRATARRVTLASLYSQIDYEKFDLAIENCKHFLEVEPRYTSHCLKLLVNLYWKTKNYQAANKLLQKILDERPMHWAACAMAKTQLLMQNYEKAIELGKKVIDNSANSVEAYDIVAEAYLLLDKKPEALKYIQDALSLSPFSIERHFSVCEIARENGDYEIAMDSAKAIYDLSRRSVHKNVNHLCGYVRSILDFAENAPDKKIKNRQIQETLLTMQRLQHDELVSSKREDFDFKIFEQIVVARMQYLDGKQTEAKRILEEAQIKIEKEFTEYPVSMAADSLKLMFDMGDFEEANKLVKLLKQNPNKIDSAIRYLMETEQSSAETSRNKYVEHTKKGIALYSNGNFHDAFEEFQLAKKVAPLNIGVNLNLLQCLVKLIKASKKPDPNLIKDAKDIHRFVKNMPLKNTHLKKYEEMKEEVFSTVGD